MMKIVIYLLMFLRLLTVRNLVDTLASRKVKMRLKIANTIAPHHHKMTRIIANTPTTKMDQTKTF